LDSGPDLGPGDNIAVPSSHVGLLTNPLSLAALSDRLAQDPADWQPFDWRTCLGHAFLGRRATPTIRRIQAVGT
jgi:hypothetical protein